MNRVLAIYMFAGFAGYFGGIGAKTVVDGVVEELTVEETREDPPGLTGLPPNKHNMSGAIQIYWRPLVSGLGSDLGASPLGVVRDHVLPRMKLEAASPRDLSEKEKQLQWDLLKAVERYEGTLPEELGR